MHESPRCLVTSYQPALQVADSQPRVLSSALLVCMTAALLAACGEEQVPPEARASASAELSSGAAAGTVPPVAAATVPVASSDAAGLVDAGPALPARCEPLSGTTGSPKTIRDVVDLLNGLPKPVTIPCLLQSLDRPLLMQATYSAVSAQPADGARSPRIFLLLDGLILSVVPDGDARELLELGELTSTTSSIKAELQFPIEQALSYSAPFERILSDSGGTHCAICHSPERPAPEYGFDSVFDSIAYRVSPTTEVNFDYVAYNYEYCDFDAEPERCEFLSALFDQGEVSRGAFPSDMAVFF